jgi:hypothetical protein
VSIDAQYIPASKGGIQAAWISVGILMDMAVRAWTKAAETPKSVNDFNVAFFAVIPRVMSSSCDDNFLLVPLEIRREGEFRILAADIQWSSLQVWHGGMRSRSAT